MEGYLRLRINPLVRRLITRLLAIIPAIIFIIISGEDQLNSLLIFSQVILSIQLAFAIIPLIHFVSDKEKMGAFSITKKLQFICWIIAAVLVFLNLKMVIDFLIQAWASELGFMIKILMISGIAGFIIMLFYVVVFPYVRKNKNTADIHMHTAPINNIKAISKPAEIIAIALDFGGNEDRLITTALHQGGRAQLYILIHVVESPSAIFHGTHTDDYETRQDRNRLSAYVQQLIDAGYQAKGVLGYQNTASEITRIVMEEKADLLIMGAHGHKGIKDFIFGTTIDKVRHKIKTPILIVGT